MIADKACAPLSLFSLKLLGFRTLSLPHRLGINTDLFTLLSHSNSTLIPLAYAGKNRSGRIYNNSVTEIRVCKVQRPICARNNITPTKERGVRSSGGSRAPAKKCRYSCRRGLGDLKTHPVSESSQPSCRCRRDPRCISTEFREAMRAHKSSRVFPRRQDENVGSSRH